MNALVSQPKFNAQVPAFLRRAEFFSVLSGMTGGITGGQPPTISVKGSKWRLVADGQVLFVNQMHLDVVVVGNNKYASKSYFEGEFDEANPASPLCWSDNGVGPSSQVSSPVHYNCGNCPKNAFGSKVSGTGGSGKACKDTKKLAVVLAAQTACLNGNAPQVVEPFQQVYLLSLPTMSMKPWKEFVDLVEGHDVPVKFGVIARLGFDPSVAYPKVTFAPIARVSTDLEAVLTPFFDDPAIAIAVGANDVPLSSGTALATQQLPQGLATFAAPVSVQPAPAHTPTPTAPVAAAPALTTFPQAIPAAPTPEAPAPTARRRRQAAPQPQVQASAPVQVPQGMPFATGAMAPMTVGQSTVGNGVIQTPQASDAGLDAQLDALFS